MIPVAVRRTFLSSAILFACLAPITGYFGSNAGFKSFVMGFAASEISVFSFVLLAAATLNNGPANARTALLRATLAMMVKMPIIGFLGFETSKLGPTAMLYFLAGAALVYCCLIGSAYADSKTRN